MIVACVVLLESCNTIRSSLNYTHGSQCCEAGNYEEARGYLEKAVELDPDMGRNHYNLAIVYVAQNELDKAWISIRKAISAKYSDDYFAQNFHLFYEACVRERNFDQVGTSRKEIEEKLGSPDMVLAKGNQYIYGLALLTFKEDKLTNVGFLNL